MLDTKTRDEILLEEKIAQIDDLNFDKIYDVDDFTEKQIERFDDPSDNIILNTGELDDVKEQENSFEVEVEKNEFLENFSWNQEEETTVQKRPKFKINNKLLFYTFTSIAALLCILLVYNVFVINSLSVSLQNAKNLKVENTYGVSTTLEEENNYILLEDGSHVDINGLNYYSNQQNAKQNESTEFEQTNWFDVLVCGAHNLFGG